MFVNRSYLQLIIKRLVDWDWSWDNQNKYSDYFDIVASLLPKLEREELNAKLWEFSIEWYGITPMGAESIIFSMQKSQTHRQLKFRSRIPSYDGDFDKAITIYADWEQLEVDLKHIKSWCLAQLNKLVREQEIDFSQEALANIKTV